MKKLLVAAILAGFASSAMAAIAGSRHDFTGDFTGANANVQTAQICIYCHAPHNTSTASTQLPLWNRAFSATKAYQAYSAPLASGHSASTTNFTPGTRACLGCHDGSTTDVSVTVAYGDISPGAFSAGGVYLLSTDLQNDHPIGMQYATAITGPGGYIQPKPATLPFFTALGAIDNTNGFMQCSSCHEVHNTFNFSFLLRVANTGSALCLSCHNK